jgi:hypothetical protein
MVCKLWHQHPGTGNIHCPHVVQRTTVIITSIGNPHLQGMHHRKKHSLATKLSCLFEFEVRGKLGNVRPKSTSLSFLCSFQIETHIDSNLIAPQASTHASTTIKAPAFATSEATIFSGNAAERCSKICSITAS